MTTCSRSRPSPRRATRMVWAFSMAGEASTVTHWSRISGARASVATRPSTTPSCFKYWGLAWASGSTVAGCGGWLPRNRTLSEAIHGTSFTPSDKSARPLSFHLHVESRLGTANQADAPLDLLAVFRRDLDFQVRQVTMPGCRLNAHQRPALLEQLHQFLPRRLHDGIGWRSLGVGRQVLGEEIDGRFQGLGQGRQGRVVPQSVQPDHAILDSQGRGQFLGAGPRYDFIFAGVDHQHAALLGPFASPVAYCKGSARTMACSTSARSAGGRRLMVSLSPGFSGVVYDRQQVAARQEQHGPRDPRLLPGGRAGQNPAHRNAHHADLPRIDFGPRRARRTVRRTSSTPWARASAKSRGSAARARVPPACRAPHSTAV